MHGVMGADARLPRDHVTSIALGELEKSIGLRLLHRTTRRIELADAGQIYYESSRRIVEEARIAHDQLGEMRARPSGVLRASRRSLVWVSCAIRFGLPRDLYFRLSTIRVIASNVSRWPKADIGIRSLGLAHLILAPAYD